MPVELKDLKLARARKIDVDGYFAIDWNPTNMTPSVYAALEAWRESADRDPFHLADVYLAPLITGWDIVDDGQPYPVNADNIKALGIDLVLRLGDLIDADYKLDRETKKGSAAS